MSRTKPRGRALVTVLEQDIAYLLRDEFTNDLAAGAVNGTNALPGPGTRVVVDTENKISLSGGNLVVVGGRTSPGFGNPSLALSQTIDRVEERSLIFEFTPTNTGIGIVGLVQSASLATVHTIYFVNGTVFIKNENTDTNTGKTVTTGNSYLFKITLLSTGAIYYWSSDAGATWEILFIDATLTTTPLRFAMTNYNLPFTITDATIYKLKDVHFYDNFARANGAIGIADSGYVYAASGTNTPIVSGNEMALTGETGSGYAFVTLPRNVTRLDAHFHYHDGADGDNGVCIAVCDGAGSLANLIHYWAADTACGLQVRQDTGDFVSLGTWTYDSIADGATYYLSMSLSGNVATLTLPDGTTQIVTDARIGTLANKYCYFELGRVAGGHAYPHFNNVAAWF